MKILVVGLGNPILGDDGVGWRIADELITLTQCNKDRLHKQELIDLGKYEQVQFEQLSTGGLRLMEQLVGYDYAIIIDSIVPSDGEPGKVIIASIDNLLDLQAGHITSTHDTSLQTAMRMGRMLGAHLPNQVDIVGIKVDQNFDFSEDLSEEVEKAIPTAVETVNNLLKIKMTSEETS